MATKPVALPCALPEGMTKLDLTYITELERERGEKWVDGFENAHFEMYAVEFRGGSKPEWVIATLAIGGKGRTYGIRISTGTVCRVGAGPHVKATVTVHVRVSRAKALQKYTDLRLKGATEANQIRDRISSRRAEGQVMRAQGRHSWTWSR
jgi:hypothetical protein